MTRWLTSNSAIVAQLRRLCESAAARDRSAVWTIEEKIEHWRSLVNTDFQSEEAAFIGVSDLAEAADESEDPILVKGFPILKKPKGFMGLEMPLNMVAALVDSPRITVFTGAIFIKASAPR